MDLKVASLNVNRNKLMGRMTFINNNIKSSLFPIATLTTLYILSSFLAQDFPKFFIWNTEFILYFQNQLEELIFFQLDFNLFQEIDLSIRLNPIILIYVLTIHYKSQTFDYQKVILDLSYKNNNMPKQIIISMQENYPFGQCEECTSQMTRVLVRKIYQVSLQQRNKLMQKVNILRKLKNQHMIKIQSVLQEEQSIHFLFQYIPIKLQTWISNINDQFIQCFRDQLIKFSSFLANNYIKIEFQLKNIGMDQNYGAKYFLDINFDLDPNVNREKLKSTYIRDITNLFKPYIFNISTIKSTPDSDREAAKSRQQLGKGSQNAKKQETAISPPTNKPNNKGKEKALEKYYQEVNMSVDSQNQKILQEFMDVLDNEREEESFPKPTLPSKQQSQINNTFINQKTSPKYYNSNTSYQDVSGYQHLSYNQNHIYSEKQFPSDQQAQAFIYSAKNIHPSKQGSYSVSQALNIRPSTTSHPMGKGKSETKQMSEIWRQSADLQNRVKNAIQKSMNVIKKFKNIKESFQG